MRWTDYLATLSPSDHEDLLNALTIGIGRVALAARVQRRDGATAAVAESLQRAMPHLQRSSQLLTAAGHTSPLPPPTPALDRSPADAGRVPLVVAELAGASQQVLRLVAAGAELADVADHLAGMVATVEEVLARLGTTHQDAPEAPH